MTARKRETHILEEHHGGWNVIYAVTEYRANVHSMHFSLKLIYAFRRCHSASNCIIYPFAVSV